MAFDFLDSLLNKINSNRDQLSSEQEIPEEEIPLSPEESLQAQQEAANMLRGTGLEEPAIAPPLKLPEEEAEQKSPIAPEIEKYKSVLEKIKKQKSIF